MEDFIAGLVVGGVMNAPRGIARNRLLMKYRVLEEREQRWGGWREEVEEELGLSGGMLVQCVRRSDGRVTLTLGEPYGGGGQPKVG